MDEQRLKWLRSIARILGDVAMDANVIKTHPQAAILAAVAVILVRKAIGGFEEEFVYRHLEASAEAFYEASDISIHGDRHRYLAATVLVAASIIEGLPSSDKEVQDLVGGLKATF